MIKASDLVKEQHDKDKRKLDTYNKIYIKVEQKIKSVSSSNNYFTLYEVPQLILGIPLYDITETCLYISKKLKKNGFNVEYYKPNKLLIIWLPSKN